MQILKLASTIERKATSQYRGVNWDKQYRKWKSSIVVDGRKRVLGYFEEEEEAARTYKQAAVRHGRNVVNDLSTGKKAA